MKQAMWLCLKKSLKKENEDRERDEQEIAFIIELFCILARHGIQTIQNGS